MLLSFYHLLKFSRKFSQVATPKSSMPTTKIVCIDINGTLHVDYKPYPGSIDAINRLKASDLDVKFITNTSLETRQSVYDNLTKIGFAIELNDIYTCVMATRDFVKRENLKPMFIVDESVLSDELAGLSSFDGEPDSVVVGLSPNDLTRANLNQALRILLAGGVLVAAHKGKFFKTGDDLSLGPGAFVKALEYAARTNAVTMGKPTSNFFKGALDKIPPEEAIMIGDDIKDDVYGAQSLGMRGYLVKSGKYLPGDEDKFDPKPYKVVDSLAAAVDDILASVS